MSKLVKFKEIHCPWCHNRLDIIRSSKTGLHFANCGSCNAHFHNIPLALMGIPDNSTAIMKGNSVEASSSTDNAKLKFDKEKSLEMLRKGIPRNLWKYLDEEEDDECCHNRT
jgi:hypothetical protein